MGRQRDREAAAHDPERTPLSNQQVGRRGQAEGCDRGVDSIGRGGSQPRRRADSHALDQRPANAQQADRANRGRDRKTYDEAADICSQEIQGFAPVSSNDAGQA